MKKIIHRLRFFTGNKKIVYFLTLFLLAASLSVQSQTCTVRGTMFPFVNIGYPPFDDLFSVKAELHALPPSNIDDPLTLLFSSEPLYTAQVVNYDGSIFVPGTPKNPGTIGAINNPGLPIDWSLIGKVPEPTDGALLTEADNIPSAPIGLYTFTNVVPGDYILILYRSGYVKRIGKISVEGGNMELGHRELIAGDINNDLNISLTDLSLLNARIVSSYGDSKYEARFDLNADGIIDRIDNSLILNFKSFSFYQYQETMDYLNYWSENKTYNLSGTIFPFVSTNDPAFDALFSVRAELYAVPSEDVNDPIAVILRAQPLYTSEVINYDGSVFLSGTPKNPGQQGMYNNPGLSIRWGDIGKTQGTVDNTLLTANDNIPSSPLGMYTFNSVPPGDYILLLSREGYIPRFAKITVSKNGSKLLGHRELVGGDVNDDLLINIFDVSKINSKRSIYGNSTYEAKYDLDAEGIIGDNDISIATKGIGFKPEIYQETKDWLSQ